MNRDTRFLISRRPYAVDLSSLRGSMLPRDNGGECYQAQIGAVWFRRRSGITVACIGTLSDFQNEQPANAVQFLERHTDGRYGGNCDGRWDGTNYWGNGNLTGQVRHLIVLRPMLAAYPALPVGFDGWWRF